MTSPFWHTQHGVSSPLWQTQPKPPRRPERPERPARPDTPASNPTPHPRSSTPGRRTRVETQYRPPVPTNRPPIRSRYTAPEDESRPNPNASSMLPRRASGSPGRVYSSSTQPYECRSPVMTLRILSPSRHGARDERERDGQENRPVQEVVEPPLPSPGLARSKLTSPKRRRLPLRDSILLKRKDSPDSSKVTTPTRESMPVKAPETPEQQVAVRGSLPPTPSTPSKSRLKGFPRLGSFYRESKPPPPPEYRQSEQFPPRKEVPVPEINKKLPVLPSDGPAADAGGTLVSRISTMILDEGIGAGADRSSAALKVWDAVAKCLDGIANASTTETASKPSKDDFVPDKVSQDTPAPASKSIHPWPLEAWGLRHNQKQNNDNRRVGEGPKEGEGDVKLDAMRKAAPVDDVQQAKTTTTVLPCPFRTRNPARFNVSDSWHCAQGQWKSLSDLQQHITRHHRHASDSQLFQCPRCEKGFPEPNAFKEHLMLPREQMCDPRSETVPPSSDPEDGITAGRARTLSEGVEAGKIGSWGDLWKCLFPDDRIVPRPAILPAIELPQVEQEVFTSANMSTLKASLEERLKFLASQSANSDLLSAQIPVITGSLSLAVEAHLRSVFIACRTQPPSRVVNRSRSASQTQDAPNNRPRKLSTASSAAGVRNLFEPPENHRRPPLIETRSFTRDPATRPHIPTQRRSLSEGSPKAKLPPRTTNLPIPATLTIPFPRISALTEHSDAGPEGNTSPKGTSSDAEYSSGVESNPTSAGGLRDSNNTDIRCSKCNMRPSLRPNEDVFCDPRLSAAPSTHTAPHTTDSSCRFSDSGIGILCRNCRMLEELINSYSRASLQSADSSRPPAHGTTGPESKSQEEVEEEPSARLVAPFSFSPDLSVSIDENDEETLFDLMLDSSAAYVEGGGGGDGQQQPKTQALVSSPMFPPPTQDLPPSPYGKKYDRHGGHDGGFF
ncbi:hypothetical protein GCG54_00001429 [Colletotrichum gloeosporioides]|uniref:C2H2-type domain-containing protein n=1 Tax=Colletotrichum gloeosporioides TaxID=474922 RepID=A0A8H4C8W3_COLGL|nr:uncharacterized protein GCG54_00001429 [Colletotrichum gloeosporioides]KAF3799387.1 hypothetical protein GCG54_00001429 [Colletotrichum gloeosporioides]